MSAFSPEFLPSTPARALRSLATALLVTGLIGCTDAGSGRLTVGQSFPLGELDSTIPLGDFAPPLSGRTLVINFWATWCAPCRREMPDLQRLSDRLDPARHRVIGVSVDTDVNLIREFVRAHDIRFPIRQDRDRNLASAVLGLEVYPTTFVVSPDGTVVARIDGAIEAPPMDDAGGALPGFVAGKAHGG